VISRIRGEVWDAGAGRLVVGCGGVGYELLVPTEVAALAVPGATVDLHTRLIVREDEWLLFGFADRADRRAFDLVREAKGCGPKLSLALVGHLGASNVAQAVASNDTATLARVPGIGVRTAERICTELRDKVAELAAEAPGPAARPHDDEVVAALVSLGYKRSEAEAATRDQDGGTVEDRIRTALRALRR
jgi:Holliday junction DNA helicase RuvA